jgi:hypothetical protein
MQTLSASQVSPETPLNENFETLEHQAVYGKRQPATTGLTWGYYGGRWGGVSVADGTLTLTNAASNYLVVLRSTGAISTSTATTNWNNTAEYARVYKITTAGSVVTAVEDHRAGPFGVHGPRVAGRWIRSISAAYPFVLADQDTIVLHPSADTSARTWTIPANASVSYPLGTQLQIINQASAGVLTIAITSDTMRLAGAGTTGSRTLAANGIARATKITATEWIIEGTGLT